jgi:hypothetical protein
MTKRPLIWKILAIANALLVTAVFVGCPARKDPTIVSIAPPPPDPPPFVSIAPYGGNFQHFIPPNPPPQTPSQDAKSDKRGP